MWVPDKDAVWKGASVVVVDKEERLLKVQTEDGQEQELKIAEDASNLPPLRNPDILVGSDDLTDLSYLHEPAGLAAAHTTPRHSAVTPLHPCSLHTILFPLPFLVPFCSLARQWYTT